MCLKETLLFFQRVGHIYIQSSLTTWFIDDGIATKTFGFKENTSVFDYHYLLYIRLKKLCYLLGCGQKQNCVFGTCFEEFSIWLKAHAHLGYGSGNNRAGLDTTTGKTIVLIHHYKGQYDEACWDRFSGRRQVEERHLNIYMKDNIIFFSRGAYQRPKRKER